MTDAMLILMAILFAGVLVCIAMLQLRVDRLGGRVGDVASRIERLEYNEEVAIENAKPRTRIPQPPIPDAGESQ